MIKLKKIHLIGLSFLAGILLSLAWPVDGFPGLLFIGFIPILLIEDYIFDHRNDFGRISVFFLTFPAFLIWNILTTWWIWDSTAVGAILAIVLNSIFMAMVMYIFHLSRKGLGSSQGQYGLIFFWITFEYIHHHWDITWPWLSLGNGFASYYKWIQWYEFTGIFGGTLWVLLVNILLYRGLKNLLLKKNMFFVGFPWATAFLLVLIPLIISFSIYNNYEEKSWPVDVVAVQPNVDPYKEQYFLPPPVVIKRNLDLAKEKMDSTTDFIVSPESSIQENIWEHHLEASTSLETLKKFTLEHPRVGIVIGASTFKEFEKGEPLSPTARKFSDGDGYYDAFNTAFYIADGAIEGKHHKSKLTPGVERMPFAGLMKPIEKFAINLGGTFGSLGTDPYRTVFTRKSDGLKIAPVICYESVYGEYVAEYIRKGANLIFVITNDGWWGDTPGHRQHFTFSRLRAIETRRSVARSANTGTSAFIDQRGDAFQMTKYWVQTAIRQKINANDSITFYVKYGDYIARVSAFVAVFLLLFTIARILMHRKKR